MVSKPQSFNIRQLKEGPTVPFCDVEALCQVPYLSWEGVASGLQSIQLGTSED